MSGIIPKMLGLHDDIIKRGTLFYVRVLIPMVFFLLAMFAIGFLFNIAGYKGANLIFSLILTLLMVLLAARPEAVINIFLAGAISGAVLPGHTMSGEVEKFFRWYTGLVTQVMLWTSIIFLFLGTVSAKGRFNALVGIIATVVLLQLIQAVWKIGRSWGKPFVYLWAVVYLGYFVLQGTGYLPQAEYYVNRWTSGIEIISGGEAARIKNLEDIRNQQRAEMVDRAYEKAEKWQIANPGRDLPEELTVEIEAAKKGLSLEEYNAQRKAEAEAKAKVEKEKIEKKTLIETVNLEGSQFPREFGLLLPGEYQIKFEPEEAAFNSYIVCINNEETVRPWNEKIKNNSISIKVGTKGFAIWSPIPSIARIYAQ
ncbi:MAG: hypothetical protein M0Z56_09640 [Desulfobacteraceae bacterium]|nr:hypothetical protein [Desulfobacteraceae bacterium]